MKRLLMAAVILFLGSVACYANTGDASWVSSNTITADTTKSLCGFSRRALLHGVCVNDAGGGGTISLFNSRGTATNRFAIIRSTALITSGCNYYDVQLSSGATYTTSTVNDDVTFMFQCY